MYHVACAPQVLHVVLLSGPVPLLLALWAWAVSKCCGQGNGDDNSSSGLGCPCDGGEEEDEATEATEAKEPRTSGPRAQLEPVGEAVPALSVLLSLLSRRR